MTSEEMRRFWDARARENALFFVDNKLDYRNPDEEVFWTRGEAELDSVLDPVGAVLTEGDDVVEIGCGVGRMTRVIARRAATVQAIDISPEMLAHAREHNAQLDNVQWLLGDGVSLAPIPDSSAGACVSHVVFHHIPDPKITLGYVREIGRVLRTGGWAAFQISNAPELHHPRGGREGLQIRWRALTGRGPKGQAAAPWIGSAIALDDLRAAADDGGMDLERVVGEGQQLCFVLLRRR